MTVQEFIAAETERAMEGLIHQVRALPADKVAWKPMDEGRTALDQMAECALIAKSLPQILGSRKMPDFTPEMIAQFESDKAAIDTVEKGESLLRDATAATVTAIRAMPDEALQEQMHFWGPEPWSVAGVMAYHSWNMNYHTGQVCYIQTLLGDKKMG